MGDLSHIRCVRAHRRCWSTVRGFFRLFFGQYNEKVLLADMVNNVLSLTGVMSALRRFLRTCDCSGAAVHVIWTAPCRRPREAWRRMAAGIATSRLPQRRPQGRFQRGWRGRLLSWPRRLFRSLEGRHRAWSAQKHMSSIRPSCEKCKKVYKK